MKKIMQSTSILLLLCVLVLTAFVGCDVFDSNRHRIEMKNESWLYEKLPSSANVGDEITVKIRFATDLGYIFVVNGEQIEPDDVESKNYWQFSFTMPDEDVVIDFKTYDGFLPDPAYGTLIETYWMQNLDAEHVSVREYYGEYDNGVLVAIIDAGDYTANEWSEKIAGYSFAYGDGNRLTALYDGKFYTLPEAYEKKYLTKESINNIFSKYYANHSGAYNENEIANEKNIFLEKAEEIKEYSANHFETALTQYDMNVESGIVRDKWDALLSEVHKYLEKNLTENEYKNLQENEYEWILEKEKAINDAAEEWKGGSGEPMVRNMEAIRLMKERFDYLITLFK